MEQITVSSKGQIAIPRKIREALNLAPGTKLTIETRGNQIVLSKEPAWKRLQGSVPGDLMAEFIEFRKRERELEDKGA